MIAFLILFLHVLVSPFKTQARLEAEIVLLRHQLSVLRRQRQPLRPKLVVADRLLFVWLYRLFPSVLNAVTNIRPETIVRWHRTGSDCIGAGSRAVGAGGRGYQGRSAV
jgi:hypothetical protein